jgi:hypothetical protein
VVEGEGSLEDYLRLTHRVLGSLTGFPSTRALALQQAARDLALPWETSSRPLCDIRHWVAGMRLE